MSQIAGEVSNAGNGLAMLSWIGAVLVFIGVVFLTITRGATGWRAVMIGIGVCILNFAVANYMAWLLLPVLVATGCVTLAWSYLTVRQMLNKGVCTDG